MEFSGVAARLERFAALGAIVGAIAFLVVFGIVGVMKPPGAFGFDLEVFIQAGQHWLADRNPWEAMLGDRAFSYPPHITPLLIGNALLPESWALVLHTVVFLSCAAILCYLANRWFLRVASFSELRFIDGMCFAVIIGSPFMVHNLFMGQPTLLFISALFLSWHFWRENHWLIAGVLLGVATIKPQVAILFVFWLLLSGAWRVVAAGALTSLVLMLPSVVKFGPLALMESWFAALAHYASAAENAHGSVTVISFDNVFAFLGWSFLGGILKIAAFVATLFLFFKRDRLHPVVQVQTLCIISLLLIYGHDYDLAAVMMLGSYTLYRASQRSLGAVVAVLGVLLVLCVPQRAVRDVDFALVTHWRSFFIPVLWILCVWMDRPASAASGGANEFSESVLHREPT